jgi:hypothetical protein
MRGMVMGKAAAVNHPATGEEGHSPGNYCVTTWQS